MSVACIAFVNRIRHPFNVNTLAPVAALAALGDEALEKGATRS